MRSLYTPKRTRIRKPLQFKGKLSIAAVGYVSRQANEAQWPSAFIREPPRNSRSVVGSAPSPQISRVSDSYACVQGMKRMSSSIGHAEVN